jgi:hypothetical protein
MSTMVSEAMHRTPDVDRFKSAAKEYHKTMLTTFPKVTLRIYEHALLCHVPDVLVEGSLLDGSSWFLEAYNKVWKHQLLYHSNSGGGSIRTRRWLCMKSEARKDVPACRRSRGPERT